MNNQLVALAVQQDAEQEMLKQSRYDECCRFYRQRLDALALIKQLNQLSKSVQKHRGLSMALLAGDEDFSAEFTAMQRELDRRIAMIRAFVRQSGELLSDNEQQKIEDSWMTLRSDWHDDAVIDNFELHSHFIEQLLNFMTRLGKYLERPMFDCLVESTCAENQSVMPSLNGQRVVMQLGLLAFVCKLMPDMIELVAKVRGLATHAMVVGECSDLCGHKLRYLMRCVLAQREKLNLGMSRMTENVREQIPSLPMIKTYDLKLMYMVDKVEQEVLSDEGVSSDQHSFFALASDIIGVYVEVVNEGLELLQHWQEQQLEDWMMGQL